MVYMDRTRNGYSDGKQYLIVMKTNGIILLEKFPSHENLSKDYTRYLCYIYNMRLDIPIS